MVSAGDEVRNRVVFLHIGKNAGTQITFISQQLKAHGIHIDKVSHDTKLRNIDRNTRYFFSIRDPISRFRSGFYSRKRKGQPRLYVEWSRYEAYAFGKFEHANDLAESLFRTDERGRLATMAISCIRHTAMQQIDWFEGVLNFDLRPPVWIIRQEHFEEDCDVLLRRLGLDIGMKDLTVSSDVKIVHKNDYTGSPELSELARRNLGAWYARDIAFYNLCTDWMHANGMRQ